MRTTTTSFIAFKNPFVAFALSLVLLGLLAGCKKEVVDDDEPAPVPSNRFTDLRDGQQYTTVTIAGQLWMAENLRYLPQLSDPCSASHTEPHYYVYGFEETNIVLAKETDHFKTYGVLYNWPAALAGDVPSSDEPLQLRGICPNGWHLPSFTEWSALVDSLGGSMVAGGVLKAEGVDHWWAPNTGAENRSGFNALPGGNHSLSATNPNKFHRMGEFGMWWSSTPVEGNDATAAYGQIMLHNAAMTFSDNTSRAAGRCVRCIKDQ
jgi:uncharacterized protein (TIGR02145 family)